MRLHFLARQLALNLSGLATRQPQVASPQWIRCSEWPGMLRQLSTEEQQLLCKLFKELYCDSLPSIR